MSIRVGDGLHWTATHLLAPLANVTVLSHIPGRVRCHVTSLRGDPAQARTCQATLEILPGVQTASVSAVTGNVLVQYEPDQTTLAQIQAALELATDSETQVSRVKGCREPAVRPPRHLKGTLR